MMLLTISAVPTNGLFKSKRLNTSAVISTIMTAMEMDAIPSIHGAVLRYISHQSGFGIKRLSIDQNLSCSNGAQPQYRLQQCRFAPAVRPHHSHTLPFGDRQIHVFQSIETLPVPDGQTGYFQRMTCRCDEMVYDRNNKKLQLTGNAVVDWDGDTYQAHAISVNLDSEEIVMRSPFSEDIWVQAFPPVPSRHGRKSASSPKLAAAMAIPHREHGKKSNGPWPSCTIQDAERATMTSLAKNTTAPSLQDISPYGENGGKYLTGRHAIWMKTV